MKRLFTEHLLPTFYSEMAGVRKRLLDFYKRQQFRLKNKHQLIRIAIRRSNENKGLSLCFATMCVVDLFGVFPIIALPAALISCGKFEVSKK